MGEEKGLARQIWFGSADNSLAGEDCVETGKHANQLTYQGSIVIYCANFAIYIQAAWGYKLCSVLKYTAISHCFMFVSLNYIWH